MSPYEAREYLSRDPRSLECEALRALDDARAEVCENIDALEHVIREQSKEIDRLKNLAELHRQAIEKEVSAHDRAEIQAFYDNIASKEPSLAHKANQVQVNAIARLNSEVETLKAENERLKAQLSALRDEPCESDYKCSPGNPCRVHMPQLARETFDPSAVRELLKIADGTVVLIRSHFEYEKTAKLIDEYIEKVKASESKP